MIDNIKSEIQCLREDSRIPDIGTEEEMPRVPRIQCNMSNVPLLYYNRSTVFDILLQML